MTLRSTTSTCEGLDDVQFLSRPIEIVGLRPRVAFLYAREEQRIRSVLGDRVRTDRARGSTSVPGLPASRSSTSSSRSPIRRRAVLRSLTSRRPATCPDPRARVVRASRLQGTRHEREPAHVLRGCEEVDQMLLFRDHLRRDARRIAAYARRSASSPRSVEVRAAVRRREDAVVQEIMERARATSRSVMRFACACCGSWSKSSGSLRAAVGPLALGGGLSLVRL